MFSVKIHTQRDKFEVVSCMYDVKYKELRLQHSVYGEMPFFISPRSPITNKYGCRFSSCPGKTPFFSREREYQGR